MERLSLFFFPMRYAKLLAVGALAAFPSAVFAETVVPGMPTPEQMQQMQQMMGGQMGGSGMRMPSG
ncbi:MAG: hypothetical protein QG650_584 [Patescibacteria group bacterium]|nr:hypothetical protein [Patescibacteria group bacterium]